MCSKACAQDFSIESTNSAIISDKVIALKVNIQYFLLHWCFTYNFFCFLAFIANTLWIVSWHLYLFPHVSQVQQNSLLERIGMEMLLILKGPSFEKKPRMLWRQKNVIGNANKSNLKVWSQHARTTNGPTV